MSAKMVANGIQTHTYSNSNPCLFEPGFEPIFKHSLIYIIIKYLFLRTEKCVSVQCTTFHPIRSLQFFYEINLANCCYDANYNV